MQAELEDQILFMLSTATGSLLDNVELINTLDASKTTWEEVNAMLADAEATSAKIEAASAQYRPASVRASILFFVLNDLSRVDGMYQFSLDAYTALFELSIRASPRSEHLSERIRALNDHHTHAVYKYTARGLFERHKLLLSLQMCTKIMAAAGALNAGELQFFMTGGTVLDRSAQPLNPDASWIAEAAWDNVTELERTVPAFRGVVPSVEGAPGEWEAWYRSATPEATELPGEWEAKCSDLQRMLLVRCLRPDRVLFACAAFVANNLGRKYVEPPVLDLVEVYGDSSAVSPLVFVLSPGVDPTEALRKLGEEKGMSGRIFSVALGQVRAMFLFFLFPCICCLLDPLGRVWHASGFSGRAAGVQGQAPIATKMIEDGVREGHWVFLANCHLMTSWLPTLDKIVEGLPDRKPHDDFRLWLSSNPSKDFPIAILQRGLKMTTEPPKGLRANLLRLYNTINEESYAECKSQARPTHVPTCHAAPR